MTCSIIRTSHAVTHWSIMWMVVMACTESTYWVVVVIPINMLPIKMVRNAVIWMPPYWPIIPIERRMPCDPRWSPEPVINHRTIDIHWLNNIICTIYILITYHLHSYNLRRWIFLYKDRGYILVDVLCQYRLNHYQVTLLVCRFNHAQIIHIAIAIQIKIRER